MVYLMFHSNIIGHLQHAKNCGGSGVAEVSNTWSLSQFMTDLYRSAQKYSLGKGFKVFCTAEGILEGEELGGDQDRSEYVKGKDVDSPIVYFSLILRETTKSFAITMTPQSSPHLRQIIDLFNFITAQFSGEGHSWAISRQHSQQLEDSELAGKTDLMDTNRIHYTVWEKKVDDNQIIV